MYDILADVKTALAAVSGVKTCRIGIENGLSPDDYPIIRVVPRRVEPGAAITRRNVTVLVYFGLPVSEADGGLEAVYSALCDMADNIRNAMDAATAFCATWQDTDFDEDQIEYFKLGVSRFLVVA